ncbi:MAG: hypothetical protein LBH92_01785 [Bacteroidales bacterium]|jgi:capsular polysaccharide biosynthesis protein|nr:hypothetical protein [Bacteroidales bacterium]
MENYFDNKKLIDVVTKWKYHIIIITFLCGVAGAAVSFLVEPKYESIAIVYPANIFPYSKESHTEQILQIFQSDDIKNAVIEKLGLNEHYKIAKTEPRSNAYMDSKWKSSVSIFRTPNDAIKIRVMDVDPKKARDIANCVIEEFDKHTREMQRIKFKEVVDLFDGQRERKLKMLDSLKNEMKKYNEMGIYDVPFQAKELAEAMLKGGNSSQISQLRDAFNEHSADYLVTQTWLEGEALALQDFIEKYDRAYIEYNREFTFASVVSSPDIADRKYSPVRWIYVVLFTIAGFVLTVAALAVLEAINDKKVHSGNE